ncbi:MAG: ATP-binding cassette domain-containing protein [Methanoregula sp.]|uniref:ATP-binding cassette domain-containing protein n=1 Tax=Methanoregula sp. TaxID=2052170 RepID=UPI0025DF2155|nr:ATP-binding cassette domain-containing protein [Methanoregula sp.]MCK9630309.1 ATP-binding cassette domain-containing protein [Methanoregula sp.]
MRVLLDNTCLSREGWSLSARGIFAEGIHLVSGDTGTGKTTLALMLAGLLPPSSGTVYREGISSLMVSFQFPEYHVTGTTIRDECISWGVDPTAILTAANLRDRLDHSPLKLSRGELKRLHLACVMAREYDLLVLDEPFSSLDCREKERVCIEISHRTTGVTVIFTHEQMQFPRVDYIWEIAHGSLHSRGSIPGAFEVWEHAPEMIKKLIARGKVPENITPSDLLEAACRT